LLLEIKVLRGRNITLGSFADWRKYIKRVEEKKVTRRESV